MKEQGRIRKELKEIVTKSVAVTDCPLCCITNNYGLVSSDYGSAVHRSNGQFWSWLGS